MGHREAKRLAGSQFGNVLLQAERTRDVDVTLWLDALIRNVRHAVRALVRIPGFTLTVVLTLAFGIGANTAVVSVIDAVLLRPLPFPDGDRLVRLRERRDADAPVAPVRLADWGRMTTTFEALSGYFVEDVSDTTIDVPERVRRAVVAPGFFDVWGIQPALGRDFTDAEYRSGIPAAVIVSERYWRVRFGGRPDAIGRIVSLDGRAYSLVGVLPASFQFPVRGVDVWGPYADSSTASSTSRDRTLQWYVGVGRLKGGVTIEQARADVMRVQAQLAQQFPSTDAGVGVSMTPLKETIVAGARGSLWLLFGAVSVLLLIASANIATLLLSRSLRREQEIAVRVSLGASRRAVAAQLLIETAVLVMAGAGLGLVVASGGTAAFRLLVPALPRLGEIAINARMLLWTMAVSVLVAGVCGLVPAMRTACGAAALARRGRTHTGSRYSLQWLLVGVQVAFSVTLLTGAVLLVRSADALSRVDPGFETDRILAFRLSGNWSEHYADAAGVVQRIHATLDELRAVPGVEAVATSWTVPGVPAAGHADFALAGAARSDAPLTAGWRAVSPGYFEAMSIPLIRGELCRARAGGVHRPGAAMDLMVNRQFAERYFRGRVPLGHELTWDAGSLTGRVTGVVADARELGLDSGVAPTVYACDSAPNPFPWFLLRTSGGPTTIVAPVRERLKRIEPLRSMSDVGPLDRLIGDAYAQNRLRTAVLAAFATAALALAGLGVYGTLSEVVGHRRREVGLRVAMGARRRTIVLQLVRRAVQVVAAACAIGVVLSLAFSRALAGMLYGVSRSDPTTYLGAVAAVVTIAALAALVPAARAAAVSPMRALRED